MITPKDLNADFVIYDKDLKELASFAKDGAGWRLLNMVAPDPQLDHAGLAADLCNAVATGNTARDVGPQLSIQIAQVQALLAIAQALRGN